MKAVNEVLPKRLRSTRMDRGWTQTRLAERLGVGCSHICNLEHGHHSPSAQTLANLSRALRVPAGYLLGTERLREKGI